MDWEGPTCYAVARQIMDDIPDEAESDVLRSSLRVNVDYELEEEKLFYWIEAYPGSEDYDPNQNFISSDSIELRENGMGNDIEDFLMGTLKDGLDVPFMVNGKIVDDGPGYVDAFEDYADTGDLDLVPDEDIPYVQTDILTI